MFTLRTSDAPKPGRPLSTAALLVVWAVVCGASSAHAHELWIEVDATGTAGKAQEVHVCWGHSGEKESGESLQRQQDKLSAQVLRPDGRRQPLDLALSADSLVTKIVPSGPGYHLLGAELQTGIIDREFHGIPANTRIVMYGKSLAHVAGSDQGLDAPLGMDLEIAPVGSLRDLRPGEIVAVRVLLHGKPLGGRDALLSLATSGAEAIPEAAALQSQQWSIEAHADPRTGEVRFPLIAPGPHVFLIRYFDETAGRYEGALDFKSEFSHLEKGDTYERTMYVSTLRVNVKAK